MKKILLSSLMFVFALNIHAQEDSTKAWKIEANSKFTVGSIALSNWSAGGENAANYLFSFDYQFNYLKGNNKWDNRAIMLYGANKQGANAFEKTDDRIDLTTMYGRKAAEHWYYTIEVNFKSQFVEGYENDPAGIKMLSSKFMAPGYLTITPGIEYSPNDNLKVNMSPVSSRFTFVMHDSLSSVGAYGVDPGSKTRYEIGAYINANYKHEFNDHFGMEHLLRLYSNYLNNPQNIDVDYTGKIYVKATTWLTFDFLYQVIYDDDVTITSSDGSIGPRTQMKSVLGAGLTYTFKNF